MLQTHHVSDEETLILRFPSSFNSLTENTIIEEEIETQLPTQNHRWDLFLDNRKKEHMVLMIFINTLHIVSLIL